MRSFVRKRPRVRLAALLLGTFLPACVSAQSRVALVIGNSRYLNVPPLANPTRDSAAVASMFESARFDIVRERRDLRMTEMRQAISEFSDVASTADIAVVYFAGHGMEVDGINYLIPIDARLRRDFDVEDEAVPLDRILKAVEPARRLRLVILDACRDNPFLATMKRNLASRSLARGLARVEPARDTLVAFAAQAGSIALDGAPADSPFTTALVRHLVTPGVDIRFALGRVRDEVLKDTNQQQQPFVYGSLGGDVVSLVDAGVPQSSQLATAYPPTSPQHTPVVPKQLPTPPLNVAAQAFLEDYMQRVQGGAPGILDYIHQTFAPTVRFYGRDVSNQRIVDERRRLVTRWPQRTYRLRAETTRIECDEQTSLCRVSGILDFSASNPRGFKTARTVAYYEFRVRFGRDGPKIVEENGRVLAGAD